MSYSVQANDQLSWYVGGIFGNPKKKNTAASTWKETYSRWQLSTGAAWKGDKDEVSFSLAWIGNRTSTNSNIQDIGLMLNSTFLYTHHINDVFSASLAVDNIFDRDNLTDGGYYSEGRNYMVTVDYKF